MWYPSIAERDEFICALDRLTLYKNLQLKGIELDDNLAFFERGSLVGDWDCLDNCLRLCGYGSVTYLDSNGHENYELRINGLEECLKTFETTSKEFEDIQTAVEQILSVPDDFYFLEGSAILCTDGLIRLYIDFGQVLMHEFFEEIEDFYKQVQHLIGRKHNE
jgi:hypothetical protein